MFNRFIPILALALACGGEAYSEAPADAGADAGAEELGQVAFAITVPTGYGRRETAPGKSDGSRCTSTQTTACKVPKTRSPRFKFQPSAGTGCSSWYQARLVEAEAQFEPILDSIAGWEYEHAGSTGDVYLRCDNTKCNGNAGCVGDINETCSGTAPTRYCKADYVIVYINPSVLESNPGWATATETERRRITRTLWKHEMGHAIGLGHDYDLPPDPMNMMQVIDFYQDGTFTPDHQLKLLGYTP